MSSQEVWSSVLIGVTGVVLWRAGRWLRTSGRAWAAERERRTMDSGAAGRAEEDGKLELGTSVIPAFRIDEDAVRYLAGNGRRFYIWAEAVGGAFSMLKTSVDEPALDGTQFTRYRPGEGLEIYVDETIPPPSKWQLTYHRLPHRHIRADYDDGNSKALGMSSGAGG